MTKTNNKITKTLTTIKKKKNVQNINKNYNLYK